jgi:hypothetical protein
MSNFWILPGNWLVVSTPLKNMSWDDDIPNMMGKIIQIFQTTNQNSPVEFDDIYIYISLNLCLVWGFSSEPRLMTFFRVKG